MTPQVTIINNINKLAGQKSSFFFLIDIEKTKPLVLTPHEAKAHGLLFDINRYKSFDATPKLNVNPEVKIHAVNFERYKKAFDHVLHHLNLGDSYLVGYFYHRYMD